jgi:hypothetical protein
MEEKTMIEITSDITINHTVRLIAIKYIERDYIDKIEINKIDNGYHIKSYFNVLSQKRVCELNVDENFHLLNSQCDCEFHSLCPHVLATIYKIKEFDIEQYPFEYVSKKSLHIEKIRQEREEKQRRKELLAQTVQSRSMINRNKKAYSLQIATAFQSEKCEIEPTVIKFENDDYLSIEYKIGITKKYIIKDLTDLLERFDEKEEYSYGKFLKIVHTPESFDDFAMKQVTLISKAYQYYGYLNNQRSYYYERYRLGRYLPIIPSLLDDIFDTYYEEELNNLKLIKTNDKIPLTIQNDKDVYIISFDLQDEFQLGYKHLYYIKEDQNNYTIIRNELDEQGRTIELVESLLSDDLVILKEEFQDFYKYVLSPISDYIDITLPIEDNLNIYNEIRLYGDVEDSSTIYFQLYYLDEQGKRIPGFNNNIITTYQQDLVEQYIKSYSPNIDKEKHKIYFSLDEEKTYGFINEGIEFLKQYCEVFVSEDLKRIGQKMSYNLSVGVKIQNNLLELDLDSDIIPKDEIIRVLEQYKRKKKFYRLKSGELLYLNSPELDELDELFDQYHINTKDFNDGNLQLSTQRMFALNEDAQNTEYISIDRKESFKDEINRFYSIDEHHYELSDHYNHILRDYQKEGYTWMRTLYDYGFNGILADDMGLGKTLQVITLLDELNSSIPSLVVCPASLIYNWEDEVHKFSDTLNVKCIVGNANERSEIIAHYKDYQLLVTSYDYMRRDYELYEDKVLEYLILDEAQNIKNLKTQNAQSVKKLTANHKLALTGTPIENSLAELWSIFDFLMPQYLFNYHYFKKQYETDIVKNNNEEKTNQLKKLVSPFILRRNKKEVLTELPDKIEKTLVIPFNEEEQKIYLSNLMQVNKDLQQILNNQHIDKIEILALLTKLRQICCEPRMIFDNIENTSSKMKACIDIIQSLKENKQKVLLFSSFTKVFDLLEDELRMQGISYYMLTGQTSKEDRRTLVSQFQNDDTDVFLISLKAGGTGLNLTSASAVIHFDPWWNMSAQNQATDRAYRIGQNNNVQVYKLVMKDSIEEKIIKLQDQKKELADLFVENNDISISNMSNDDIMELFSI